MPRKRHRPEQIIPKLREAEVELAKGQTIFEVARKVGITEQTYYRWRKEYGGLRLDQAKRLKEAARSNSAYAARSASDPAVAPQVPAD